MNCALNLFRPIVYLSLFFFFGFSWSTNAKAPGKEISKTQPSEKTETETQTVITINKSGINKEITPASKVIVVPSIPNAPDLKSIQKIQQQLDNVMKINQSMKMRYALQASEIAKMQSQIRANQQTLREIKIPAIYRPSSLPSVNQNVSSLSSDRNKKS